jgi:hypothetical protein
MALVAAHQIGDFGLEGIIRLVREWSVLIRVAFPKDLVPEGMEFVDFTVVRKREGVGTFVTANVLMVESVLTVEWLVYVSNIVNEKTESKRIGKIVIVRVVTLNALVNSRFLV